MSSFRVDLSSEPSIPEAADNVPQGSQRSSVPDKAPAAKKGNNSKTLMIAGIVVVAVGFIALIGGYLYWLSFKGTPQYSLALLVDAAKRDDKAKIGEIIDMPAVVDDFLPQVTNKAVELYGKGLPPKVVEQVAKLSAPIVPAITERVNAELPRLIRERSERFGSVPFPLMVIGATYYLDITVTGDTAQIKSKKADAPLEIKMKRKGDGWQVVAVKDDVLATQIAQNVGQEIVAAATKGGLNKIGDKLNNKSVPDLLKQVNDLFNNANKK